MKKKLVAIDEGGPTSQFIFEFCMQLSELSIMLPFISDVKNNVEGFRGDLEWKTHLLIPEKGSKVDYKGKLLTVSDYSKVTGKTDLISEDGTRFPQIERKEFIIKAIAVKMFDTRKCGSIPQKDDFFSDSYDMYIARKYTLGMEKKQFEENAKLSFRAIGRFLLHVIHDGKNAIPTTVMPELYRNSKYICTFFITSFM